MDLNIKMSKIIRNIALNFFIPFLIIFFVTIDLFSSNIEMKKYIEVFVTLDVPILVFASFFMNLFLSHRLPSIKPYLLYPSQNSVIIKNTILIILFDVRTYPFLSTFLGFYSYVYFLYGGFLYFIFGFLNLLFIWYAISFMIWDFKLSKFSININFFFTVLFAFLLYLSSFLPNGVNFFLLCVVGFYLIYLVKKIPIKLQYLYDNNDLYIKKKSYAFTKVKNIFFVKEVRMFFRTKRLRLSLILIIIYFTIFAIASMSTESIPNKINIFLYITALSLLTPSEYFEKFWAWEGNSIFFIKSLPKGIHNFFYQKLKFSFFLCIPILLFHLLLSTDKLFKIIILSIIFILTLPILGGYLSSSKEMNAERNISIWEIKKSNFNKSMLFIIVPIILLNWYIVTEQSFSIFLLYLILISIFLIIFSYKAFINIKNKEF